MAKSNPVLQQLIKGIAAKSSEGRTNISWNTLTEIRKRKVREAAPEVKKGGDPADELPELDPSAAPEGAEQPAPQPSPKIGGGTPPPPSPRAPKADASSTESSPPADPSMDADSAKEDAEKANAELEKAKAEKDQAEQEIEQNAYVKLNSPSGISFLLRRLIDHATKTNSIDSLAGEFTQKLKITTPEDFSTFSDDMIPYKNIPGMAEFLSSVQSLASQKQPAAED